MVMFSHDIMSRSSVDLSTFLSYNVQVKANEGLGWRNESRPCKAYSKNNRTLQTSQVVMTHAVINIMRVTCEQLTESHAVIMPRPSPWSRHRRVTDKRLWRSTVMIFGCPIFLVEFLRSADPLMEPDRNRQVFPRTPTHCSRGYSPLWKTGRHTLDCATFRNVVQTRIITYSMITDKSPDHSIRIGPKPHDSSWKTNKWKVVCTQHALYRVIISYCKVWMVMIHEFWCSALLHHWK